MEGSEYHLDPAVETRLAALDVQTKNIMAGVESIVTIISEVKNRQYNGRPFQRYLSKYHSSIVEGNSLRLSKKRERIKFFNHQNNQSIHVMNK